MSDSLKDLKKAMKKAKKLYKANQDDKELKKKYKHAKKRYREASETTFGLNEKRSIRLL